MNFVENCSQKHLNFPRIFIFLIIFLCQEVEVGAFITAIAPRLSDHALYFVDHMVYAGRMHEYQTDHDQQLTASMGHLIDVPTTYPF
jgi:hypothetical protein